LLDFDRGAIEDFAGRWCLAFEKSTLGDSPEMRAAAKAERRSLLNAIDASSGVAQLACNPLLLTILALIKRQGVTLPNRRVELYELYLKTLITSWSKARALDKRPVGPPLDYLETIAVLGPLALWLRRENPSTGIVPVERLVEWLTGHFKRDWGLNQRKAMKEARSFLKSVHKYSCLLLERGQGRFGFIHLTFEEALAARGLVQKAQLKLDESLTLIRKYLTDPGWRETILLAVGIWGLVREQPLVAGEVVRAMLKMECMDENIGKNILLAGACLKDVGQVGMGRAAAKEVSDALWDASLNRDFPPAVQRDAGFILGRIDWSPDDLGIFCKISAAPFLFGEKKKKIVIEQSFEIAKYPVTNLQYRRFMQAGGYDHREFWSEAGWDWRTGKYDSTATETWEKNRLEARPPGKRNEPFLWRDSRWNNPLAPIVGVSWFEAEAYCFWLAKDQERPIRLPLEEEWERAARHTDGREYPWGEPFDRNRLNVAEFWAEDEDLSDFKKWSEWIESGNYKVASTTIVGRFPAGESEARASDMAGNVWEWTASWYDDKKEHRVLRGGSWFNYRRIARCANRRRFIPDNFFYNVGFRVVSPGSISGS